MSLRGWLLAGACVAQAARAEGQCVQDWIPGALDARGYHAMTYDTVRARTLLFGGFVHSYQGDTWEWDGAIWKLVATTGPEGRGLTALSFDSVRGRAVLFGGFGVDDEATWEWDGSRWTEVASTGPPLRVGHAMAYDSARQRTVLFGGAVWNGTDYDAYGDTWEWDGSTWTEVTTTGPSARNAHAMVYDPVRQRTVLFGGSEGTNYLDDTWEWDGASWTQVASGGPPPRFFAVMGYDAVGARVILHAGHWGIQLDDTWAWDGSVWTEIATPGPSARSNHGLASAGDRLIAFGGTDAADVRLGDTWELSGSTWTERTPVAPPARQGHAMAHDSLHERGILYGGLAGDGSGALADTWVWDGTRWMQGAGAGPLRRYRHAMSHDAPRARTVLFGGLAEAAPIAGFTWEYDGSTWTIGATTGPSERDGAAMCYDATRARTVLFGGTDAAAPFDLLGDTWEWDGLAWTLVATSGPSPRTGHVLAYDEVHQRAVLFGGDDGSVLGDTWGWDGSTWSLLSNAPTDPPARRDSGLAFDAGIGELVLLGGSDGTATGHFHDCWKLAGASWEQLFIANPSPRSQHALIYDRARGRLTAFGGEVDSGFTIEATADIHTLATSPLITTDPSSLHAPIGSTAQFQVTVNGSGSTSFQWRRYGVPLSDGPAPGGGTISGSASATLVLTAVGQPDIGHYDVVVTNDCGEDTSAVAKLVVGPYDSVCRRP